MITVFEPGDLDRLGERVGGNLVTRAERVARPLHNEGGSLHFEEMRRAQLIRFANRMERIAKAQQPDDPAGGVELVSYHARDASTHRFSADNEPAHRVQRIDCGDVFGFEGRRPWRRLPAERAAAGCHIAEFEACDAQARGGERHRSGVQRRGIHRRASPMSQQYGELGIIRAVEQKLSHCLDLSCDIGQLGPNGSRIFPPPGYGAAIR